MITDSYKRQEFYNKLRMRKELQNDMQDDR